MIYEKMVNYSETIGTQIGANNATVKKVKDDLKTTHDSLMNAIKANTKLDQCNNDQSRRIAELEAEVKRFK